MRFPVSIELRRSVILSRVLILGHVVAASSIVALPSPWLLRGVLLALVGMSLRNALRTSDVVALRLCAPDRLEGVFRDGRREVLHVLNDSTVFSRLVVLRFQTDQQEGEAMRATLLPDQMSRDQFRALRLWLRWHSNPKASIERSA